jgi:hypothetical protein
MPRRQYRVLSVSGAADANFIALSEDPHDIDVQLNPGPNLVEVPRLIRRLPVWK